MKQSHRIHIFGASGTGTTTLGSAAAKHLGIPHLDTDEFYWKKSNPPFMHKNNPSERIELVQRAIAKTDNWVLSGSISNWGSPLVPQFTLAVFLTLDSTIRLKRIERREAARYGNRIQSSGDMRCHHLKFMSWAKSYDYAKAPVRSLDLHNSWIETLPCKVLKLDSKKATEILVYEIIRAAT